MSKAFTKESDKEDDENERDAPQIPTGVKNYITPSGLKRLQDELRHLKQVERPEITRIVQWAAENGDRSENADYQYGKKRLREIDRRMRFLGKRLDNIVLVDPIEAGKLNPDQVFFSATVTIRDEEGSQRQYSIVGVDETDPDRGRISWISPLANALFKARVGEFVTFRSPKGERELEIIAIEYLALD